MKIVSMAWRNIWRKKRRSAMSLLAIALSVALLTVSMAIQQGSYADLVSNTVRANTGHLQIQHRLLREDHDLNSCVDAPQRILGLLEDVPHVRGAAPRMNVAVLLNSGERTFGGMLFGVDPMREPSVSIMKDVVRTGTWLDAGRRDQVMLGKMLAKNLHCKIGDQMVFIGQGRDGSTAADRLTVCGILEFGFAELDRNTAITSIEVVQDAFSMEGAVSAITILLDDDSHREETRAAVESRLADMPELVVLGWPELIPGMLQMIRIDWVSGLIMYFVLVLVVGFGIANTFLMAYMERIHEYGVLLAVGMKPVLLGGMAYLESFFLTIFGLLGGTIIGIPVTLWLGVCGINFNEPGELSAHYGLSDILYPRLTPKVVILALVIVFSVSLVMAIYPAIKAGRLRIVEALGRR